MAINPEAYPLVIMAEAALVSGDEDATRMLHRERVEKFLVGSQQLIDKYGSTEPEPRGHIRVTPPVEILVFSQRQLLVRVVEDQPLIMIQATDPETRAVHTLSSITVGVNNPDIINHHGQAASDLEVVGALDALDFITYQLDVQARFARAARVMRAYNIDARERFPLYERHTI